MEKEINWIKKSARIFLVTLISYAIISLFLEKFFNLLLRDWIFTLVMIISGLSALLIEVLVIIILNRMLEDKVPFSRTFKQTVRTIFIAILVFANGYALVWFVFFTGLNHREVGTEIHADTKYVVRDTTAWVKKTHLYNYHEYKNILVYDADIKYSGEEKWKD